MDAEELKKIIYAITTTMSKMLPAVVVEIARGAGASQCTEVTAKVKKYRPRCNFCRKIGHKWQNCRFRLNKSNEVQPVDKSGYEI